MLPPFAGGVVPGVALTPPAGAFPVVVGVALVLLPPEPQAASRKMRQEPNSKRKKRLERAIFIIFPFMYS